MSQSARRIPWIVELVLVVVVALLVAAFVRAFVAQAFYIPSGSMEDTLQQDDWIVVSKLGSVLGDLQRGDIVVFRDPGGWLPTRRELGRHRATGAGVRRCRPVQRRGRPGQARHRGRR